MNEPDTEDELGALDERVVLLPVPEVGIWGVQCPGNATEVLRVARAGMRTVLDPTATLPPELDRWFRADPEAADRVDAARKPGTVFRFGTPGREPWDRQAWAFWMERARRAWVWRSATVVNEDRIELRTALEEIDFPWGSLLQLFLGAGATDVVLERTVYDPDAPLPEPPAETPEEAAERAMIEEVERGMSSLAVGDAGRALEVLTRAQGRAGQEPYRYLDEGVGHALLLLGRLDEALVALDRSLIGEEYPTAIDGFHLRARALVFLGRGVEVEAEVAPIVAAIPTHRRAAEVLELARRMKTLPAHRLVIEARLDALERRAAALDAARRDDEDVSAARLALRRDLEQEGLLRAGARLDSIAELPTLRGYLHAARLLADTVERRGEPAAVDLDWFRLPHAAPDGVEPALWTEVCVEAVRGSEEARQPFEWRGEPFVLISRLTGDGRALVGAERGGVG